jgi:hypothetical protein
MIIFSGFYVRSPINYRTLYITVGVAIPIVILSLIVTDIILSRKRKEKEENKT